MRSFFLIFISALSGVYGFSQNAMKRTELSSEIFITPIQAGATKLLTKYVGASIAYHTVKKEFILYGEIDVASIIFLEKFLNKSAFYPKGFTRCVFENGKVRLCSVPDGKALEVCAVFDWKDEHLVYEKEEIIDPGKAQTARGLNYIQTGKIANAIQSLDSVKLPKQYFDVDKAGVDLLVKAYQNAQTLAERRKFKEGIAEIKLALSFQSWAFLTTIKPSELTARFGKAWHGLSLDQFGKIMAYVGDLNNEARQFDAAIQWHQTHSRLFIEVPEFYKLMGDAYYGKRDRTNYEKWYTQYVDKMKLQKREKQIDALILQRTGK